MTKDFNPKTKNKSNGIFSKFRNKILRNNIITIMLSLLLIISAVYILTANYLKISNTLYLEKVIELDRSKYDSEKNDPDKLRDSYPPNSRQEDPKPPNSIELKPGFRLFYTGASMQRVLGSAVILVDSDGKILQVFNARGLPDNSELTEIIQSDIKIDKSRQTVVINDESHLVISEANDDDTYYLGLINEQRDINLLKMLLLVCVVIAIFCLILGVIISLMLTKNAMIPMENAWKQQQRFISDAAHELKTPIAVIKANTELVKLNQDQSVLSQMKWLDYIEQHSQRMNKLIENLLYISSNDTQTQLEANKYAVNLSDIAGDSCMQFEVLFFEAGINFDYDDIEDGIIIKSDGDKLNQLLFILLDNSLKYTSKSGSAFVRLKKDRNKIRLSVSNTIENQDPDHDLDPDKLFDRFFKGDYSRSRGDNKQGYGLGLSIAKVIANELGAKIYARKVVSKSKNKSVIIEFILEFEI